MTVAASPPTDEKVRNGLKTLLGALGGVILALLAVRSLFADTQTYGLLERVMGGGVLGMLVGLRFWALIVALVAGVVVWLVTQTRDR